MFKSDNGVILIEMLISLIVLSVVMFMILSLLELAVSTIEYEHFATKLLQVSSMMTNDISTALAVTSDTKCLYVTKTEGETTYCFDNTSLIRQVDNSGYENVINDVQGTFKEEGQIIMEISKQGHMVDVPIWSNY